MNDVLEKLLCEKSVVIVAGAGGVGKTTTAASVGLMAALDLRKRVLVLTVDPARRLADSMGIATLGNVVTKVDLSTVSGKDPTGEMYAAMLDTKASWDDLVARYAPNMRIRDEILRNPIYKNIASRFVQSHDYIAMESLYDFYNKGEFDLIVVDTPPSRSALEFLDAPARMAEFFSSRLLRWIIAPYRNRIVASAFKPFYSVADRIIGSQFLAEVAEFFMLFQSMYDGFITRAEAVGELLRSDRTSFLVVASPEYIPVREAEFFLGALKDRNMDCGALIINRALPDYFANAGAMATARAFTADAEPSQKFDLKNIDSRILDSVLSQIGNTFIDLATMYNEERTLVSTLTFERSKILRAPYLEDDIADLNGLKRIGSNVDSIVP